jgi:SAM-dependent methyltransferase
MTTFSSVLNRLSTQPYRDSIIDGFELSMAGRGPIHRALDFGSGDGYFSYNLPKHLPIEQVVSVDILDRPASLVVPILYDGRNLPFEDRSFDLVYAIDVLHHCSDPLAALADMARCASRYLILKDHNHSGLFGRASLAILDELGNRRFGVPSPHHYQRNWSWVSWLESHDFARRSLQNPMRCHPPVLSVLNKLQFFGLWERING